jgi:hypothetical protein
MAFLEELAVSRISSSTFPPSPARVVCLAPSLAPLVNVWLKLKQWTLDSYHPELHYMRGPGPKWRKKHAHVTSIAHRR